MIFYRVKTKTNLIMGLFSNRYIAEQFKKFCQIHYKDEHPEEFIIDTYAYIQPDPIEQAFNLN